MAAVGGDVRWPRVRHDEWTRRRHDESQRSNHPAHERAVQRKDDERRFYRGCLSNFRRGGDGKVCPVWEVGRSILD